MTTAEKQDEIMRVAAALQTQAEGRILGAMGHPGYSDNVARGVLNQWVAKEITLHQALGYPVSVEEVAPIEEWTDSQRRELADSPIMQPDAADPFDGLDIQTNDGWDA